MRVNLRLPGTPSQLSLNRSAAPRHYLGGGGVKSEQAHTPHQPTFVLTGAQRQTANHQIKSHVTAQGWARRLSPRGGVVRDVTAPDGTPAVA